MKKKIIITLSIFSLFFFLVGTYIIAAIETSTSRLDKLIKLHQVETMREHLLLQIEKVQSDIKIKNTRYGRNIETVITNVRNMERTANTCLDCHHTRRMLNRLKDLKNNIKEYEKRISRIFTIRSTERRLEIEEDSTFRTGENLIRQVNNMISMASSNLESKTQNSLRNIASTKIILYILVSLGPISTVILAIFFIKGFTKPVNSLLTATRRLKSGDLNYRIEGLKDEFKEVATSFNEMSGSLKEQMVKIQWTEQMVVLGELSAGLAHEIRNPITCIKLSVEVLSEKTFKSEEEKTIVLKVIDECKRIDILIKNLLNFAKPLHHQLMAVDINNLLEETITFSMRHPSFSSRTPITVNISKDFEKRLPEVMADPMKMQQVFLNLLLNALQAMPDGGTLVVKTSYDAELNAIQIVLSDTGTGIDERMIDKIFQPFFTTKQKGTGLGLSITKRIIEQHNGTIRVENNPDGGATFKIILPTKKG
jgi:signal transduction histidine kinase